MTRPAQGPSGVDLERRRISVLTALALLGGGTLTVTGCGGGGTPGAPTSPSESPASACSAGSLCGSVSGDPRHIAEISGAQLTAGGTLVLDIQGAAEHNHTVSLSADEVVAIRAGQRLQKSSSSALGHAHVITFN